MRLNRYISYDEGAQGFLILLLVAQLFLTNGIFLVVGALCFAAIFFYLQQPYKPAVFTVIFIYHFIQVAAGVWLSNYLGKDINFRSDHTSTAIISGYVGLFCVFGPIIYYQNKIPDITKTTLYKHASLLSIQKTFQAYVIGFFAINALGGVAFLFSGLTQIIFSLVSVKWFLFLLFGMQVFIKKQKFKEFWFFAAFEFITGFYSYFSEFKTVLFFGLFLGLFFLVRISLRPLILGTLAGFLVFAGMAFFQGIKGQYRTYLNQGSKSQNVSVDKVDALGKLVELGQEQEDNSFDKSIEALLDRFQYTFHLAKAMDHVPEKVPYENGANWGRTLEFALTPRIINPDKPIYEASVKATYYTGIIYARSAQGVSFSLGYFADGYVDFGYYGMFIPLLVLGFVYGGTYFYFVRKSSPNFLFNFAVVGAMYMEFFAFEMDSTFLVGRLFATLLTFTMLKFFFFPWLLKTIQMPPKAQPVSELQAGELALPV